MLTTLAQFERESDYRPIVSAAFQWGFEKWYGPNWQGNEEIREKLLEAAKTANEAAHKVLATEFIAFFTGKDFAQFQRWYITLRPEVEVGPG